LIRRFIGQPGYRAVGLLVSRVREPCRGAATIPGGHELHGETLLEAVVREMREETSLTVIAPMTIAPKPNDLKPIYLKSIESKPAGLMELTVKGDKRDFLSFYYSCRQFSGTFAGSSEGELF
jgi:8-oxo-dGTP pyrophosphatase MutT (NUDIX family)